MWCGMGRPAGRERGRSALQASRAGDRRRCPVRAGILGLLRPNGIASPPPPGAGSKGGARRSMCGTGRGWDGICRPAGGSGRAGQGIATFCAGAEADRPGIGALGTLHPPSPEGGWRRGRRGGRGCGAERGGEGVEGRAGWERAALRRVPCFPRSVYSRVGNARVISGGEGGGSWVDPGIPLPDLPRRVARRNTELHGATFRIPASNKRQKNLSKLHRRSCACLHSALTVGDRTFKNSSPPFGPL